MVWFIGKSTLLGKAEGGYPSASEVFASGPVLHLAEPHPFAICERMGSTDRDSSPKLNL